MDYIEGSDHGKWDWTQENAAGETVYVPMDFTKSVSKYLFIKLCDGISDTPFGKLVLLSARLAGKLAAPYLWIYPSYIVPADSQAAFWYERIKNESLIMIDIEDTPYGKITVYPTAADLRKVIEKLRSLGYAGNIIIYTGHWYWLAHGSTDPWFRQFAICLARYNGWLYPPEITPPWPGIGTVGTFWQGSSTGNPANYGIRNGKGGVDEDRYFGTIEQLETLFGGAPTVPPQGDKMVITPRYTDGSKVRSAPIKDSTNANQIGTLAYGTTATVTKLSGTAGTEQWAGIDWNGKAGYIAVWYGGQELAYLTGDLPPVPPPAEETFTVELTDDQTGEVWSGTLTKQ